MKTYRLIKTYPGSPKLGYITSPKKDDAYYVNYNWIQPENYPEFWELVVEQDYEILSLRSLDIIEDLENNETINMLLKQGCSIHSVKRNDGEIFTVGDKVNNGLSNNCIIDKLYINDNKLIVDTCKNGWQYLNYIKKVKTPLFTTEDGVDIFKGDRFFTTPKSLKSNNVQSFTGAYISIPDNKVLSFSTKEKAEEYILMNKKLFSILDIENLKLDVNYSKQALLKKLKEKAKIII